VPQQIAGTDQAVPQNPQLGIESYSPRYKVIWHAPTHASSLTLVPPPGYDPGRRILKISDSKIPHRLIKVLGLPVPFPTSAWYVQKLSP
jgi:hypothetical protein